MRHQITAFVFPQSDSRKNGNTLSVAPLFLVLWFPWRCCFPLFHPFSVLAPRCGSRLCSGVNAMQFLQRAKNIGKVVISLPARLGHVRSPGRFAKVDLGAKQGFANNICLVVWNMAFFFHNIWDNPFRWLIYIYISIFFIFPYIGNNDPNWLSYFSEG